MSEKKLNSVLFSTLVCPLTRTSLRFDPDTNELVSETAGIAFPVKNGIPILLVDETRKID